MATTKQSKQYHGKAEVTSSGLSPLNQRKAGSVGKVIVKKKWTLDGFKQWFMASYVTLSSVAAGAFALAEWEANWLNIANFLWPLAFCTTVAYAIIFVSSRE